MFSRIILLICLLLPPIAYSDIVIITNVNNRAEIELNDVTRLYKVKTTSFQTGIRAITINNDNEKIFSMFCEEVLESNMSEMRSLWAKLTFIGMPGSPLVLTDQAKIVSLVTENINYIGFVESEYIEQKDVRIIHRFP